MGTTASAIQGEAAPIAQRVRVSYWDAEGNETVRFYSVELPRHEWPEVIISPKTGLPAGLDKDNPPVSEETNAQKTHFEYVLERRTLRREKPFSIVHLRGCAPKGVYFSLKGHLALHP